LHPLNSVGKPMHALKGPYMHGREVDGEVIPKILTHNIPRPYPVALDPYTLSWHKNLPGFFEFKDKKVHQLEK
jgi:hypothetical protein